MISWRAILIHMMTGFGLISSCAAQSSEEKLGRCLKDFGGIEWRLPYRPFLHVHSCASPANNNDTSGSFLRDGPRSLELIGDLTLGSDSLSGSDENYQAIQQAVYAHFDELFIQLGFRHVAVEYGNAGTSYSEETAQMLLRLPRSSEADVAEESGPPVLPYVNVARYAGILAGRDVILTYRTEAGNTWRISLDGLPEKSPTNGGRQ